MKLEITKLPAKVLRKNTQAITFPITKEIRRLVDDMVAACKRANGIGLAAPQVGRDLNLAIIYLDEAGLPPFAILNPEIVSSSKESWEVEEGCLSMPGVYGLVTRPKKVKVRFQDLEGEWHEIEDDGWVGRVMQHEIDHLNKTLIADKFDKLTAGEDLLPKFLGKAK